MSLDFPTITVLGFLLCIGIAVGFSLLLVVLRGQPVLRLWTASLWLLTLGVTLLALRPYLPLAPAILAGNAAMAGCAVLMLRGVALHLEQPLPLWRPLLMAAAFMACIFAFLVLWPDLGARLQVFSVFTLLVDGWIAWLLLRYAPVQQRTSCRLAASVFLAEAALYAVRLFLPVAPDAGEDIMRTGTPMFVTYLAGVMLELARCFAMVLLLVERMLVDLRRAARTDGLTGLLNRSAVLADGQAQLQRMRRQGRPLALLLVDVDHFKQINDRWGHLAGDQVLRHFAALLQHGLQGHDTLLGRYGGEEFVLVLAGSTQGEAMAGGCGDPYRSAAEAGAADHRAGDGHRQHRPGHGRRPRRPVHAAGSGRRGAVPGQGRRPRSPGLRHAGGDFASAHRRRRRARVS